MPDLISCSEYDSASASCRSGHAVIHPACWGGSTSCPACGSSASTPMCMKEDLPAHLIREDGLPRMWPLQTNTTAGGDGDE